MLVVNSLAKVVGHVFIGNCHNCTPCFVSFFFWIVFWIVGGPKACSQQDDVSPDLSVVTEEEHVAKELILVLDPLRYVGKRKIEDVLVCLRVFLVF